MLSLLPIVLLAAPVLALNVRSAPTTTNMQFRDVNVFATTDVHAWIAGGDQEVPEGTPVLDADYGDLVSFMELAKHEAKLQGKDVFLFDNGDVVDGTGLSNIAPDHCSQLLPLLQMVPFDALNCGNHELYDNRTMEHFSSSGYIDFWKGHYLTSNLLNATTNQPLGARYVVLEGPVSGVRVLVFGFMYDMTTKQGKCDAVAVEPVNDAVRAKWFLDALKLDVDAIVVLAHMDAMEPLIDVITTAVRARLPAMPIQVIAGHSHARKERSIDGRTSVFEPGNFFNTLGYASFELPKGNGDVTFHNVDIDTNVDTLAHSLGLPYLSTFKGRALSSAIIDTQHSLGLSKVLGCLNRTYAGIDLVTLYMKAMAPQFLFTPPQNGSQWFVQSTGSLRYDLYQGTMTVDDTYKVLPFQDIFSVIRGVKGSALQTVFARLNAPRPRLASELAAESMWWDRPSLGNETRPPAYAATDDAPAAETTFDVIMGAFDVATITNAINDVTGAEHVPERFREGFTDTLLLKAWAQASLGGPCA